jgi:hypothetical protein
VGASVGGAAREQVHEIAQGPVEDMSQLVTQFEMKAIVVYPGTPNSYR